MRKIIKKYGGTAVIVLTKDDLKCHGLNVGDVAEIIITERLGKVGANTPIKRKFKKSANE